MSTQQQTAAFANNGSKKAVHVKWAGKTIALGTFPAAEADEKCARAKALTRAWRSSMRPKPTREWVMLELERLGVRVVSGRLGRKAGDDGDEGSVNGEKKAGAAPMPNQQAALAGATERNNSIGWAGGGDADLGALITKRNSLGLSGVMNDRRGSLGSLGPVLGMDAGDMSRPMGSGGSVTGFDSFQQDQQRRNSSLGLGSLTGGSLSNIGMSVNPNQHYEMLKLHHMNLLNEIQETTLMMNLYQQQQLQQQQQQLQQQATTDMAGADAQQMALLLQQQQNQGSMDPMFGASAAQRLGGTLGGSQTQMQLLQQQIQNNTSGLGGQLDGTGANGASGDSAKRKNSGGADDLNAKRAKQEGDGAK